MSPFQTPALVMPTSCGIILIISASPHWTNWLQSKSEADQLLQSPHGLMTCKLRVHYDDHMKILMTYCTDYVQATYFSTIISSNAQKKRTF